MAAIQITPLCGAYSEGDPLCYLLQASVVYNLLPYFHFQNKHLTLSVFRSMIAVSSWTVAGMRIGPPHCSNRSLRSPALLAPSLPPINMFNNNLMSLGPPVFLDPPVVGCNSHQLPGHEALRRTALYSKQGWNTTTQLQGHTRIFFLFF